jgi:PHD/YefM family antitoxin component YafN of YafNO toxin-antitoxin module
MKKRNAMDTTEYLLSSPRNAERLLRALERSRRGEGKPQTVEEFRKQIGLERVPERHQN